MDNGYPTYHGSSLVSKSAAYKDLSTKIALAAIKKFPLFLLWNTRDEVCEKFFDRLVELEKMEPVGKPERTNTIADALVYCYLLRLSCADVPSMVSQWKVKGERQKSGKEEAGGRRTSKYF